MTMCEHDLIIPEMFVFYRVVKDTKGEAVAAIDPASLSVMEACVVDYSEDLIESGFKVVQNTLASTNCSCGASFDTQ